MKNQYTIYGIPNCGSVKKAIDFFKGNDIAYTFNDFKKMPITEAQIKDWIKQKGLATLVNKKGTTYRQLSNEDKQLLDNEDTANEVIVANNSIVKRPVITKGKKIVMVGYDEDAYKEVF